MKLLITTSTLPVSDTDEVPAFVKDQAIHLKRLEPRLSIIIHAPHNHYSLTSERMEGNGFYKEVRFHYFWPFRFELLAGRGILPSLASNRLLYGQIPFLFVCQVYSLWRLVRKERPDLLYAHWFTPQAIATVLVSGITRIPFVFTTHASDVSVLRSVPFGRKLVRFVCGRARAYTAVSDRTAGKLREFFGEREWSRFYSDKLSVVPMGVNINVPPPPEKVLARVRREYALGQRLLVLYLGRLAEKKGVEYLIEAFSQLPDGLRKRAQLVIAGDGLAKKRLERLASDHGLGNISFTGYVSGEEKEAILALADFLCIPSVVDRFGDSEGFPVVLMEGLASGKVVLASDISGGEVILKDGESGFLFPQKSSEALAAALIRAMSLSSEELKAIGKQARQLASQFSWENISSRYYRILRAAADGV